MVTQAEDKRTAAVNRYLNLKLSKEKELNDIIDLAAKICGTPTALITLVDNNTQHIRFKKAFNYNKTDRNTSFCTHAIAKNDVMIVEDALNDERFWDNPMVIQEPHIRFYAGSPLTTKDGHNVGALCVIDNEPRQLNDMQIALLNTLSNQVVTIFEFESIIDVLNEQYTEIKNSEVKLRSFFESSLSCHLLIDRDLKVVYFNKALSAYVLRLYNIHIETGMTVTDFIPEPFVDAFVDNFNLALNGVAVQSEREVEFDNETICWHLAYDPAFNADGEIIGVSYNAMDITGKVAQERKISAQNRSLRAIAQIQSHELRGPVASMIGLFDVWRAQDYEYSEEIIGMMEAAIKDIDEKIHAVIAHTPL